ncbi:MAG: M15 family metallopeptidase [Hyphomicrobiaceae bacterium]
MPLRTPAPIVLAFLFAVSPSPALAKSQLPSGFVRLADIAPTIRKDMRYAGRNNFTGRPVPGYAAAACILARPVAHALKRVQARLAKRNLSLMVFDCYRPQKAVDSFIAWAKSRGGPDTKFYYPHIARSKIVPFGYVAKVSSHSRGIAVDLTIVRREPANPTSDTNSARQPRKPGASCIDAPPAVRNTGFAMLDMGTSFDCFDKKSHTRHAGVSTIARANRRRLLKAMTAEGFRNYSREWWHFSFPAKGFGRTHNFVVD